MTRLLLSRIVLISWGLFFGANLAVFVIMLALFRELPGVAGQAGGTIFTAYERLALLVGAVLLIGLATLRLRFKRAAATLAFVLIGLASLTVMASSLWVTPRINQMRLEKQTTTPAFRSLHGRSMLLFSGQALLLLITGLILPATWREGPNTLPATDREKIVPGEA